MNQNYSANINKIGFSLKKDSLPNSRVSAFQKFVGPTEINLPKLQTDDNEKKYLQLSGANYTEEDLYDPLNPTEEHEVEVPKPKKKRKKTYEFFNYLLITFININIYNTWHFLYKTRLLT